MRYTVSTRNSMWSNWFNQYRQYRAQKLMIGPLLITYVCDWMIPTCRHWLTVMSCNAEIGELHSHAMQTYGNGTVVQCRHLGIVDSGRHWAIVHTCNSNIRCLYSRTMQTLCDWTVVQLRYWVIWKSCNSNIRMI